MTNLRPYWRAVIPIGAWGLLWILPSFAGLARADEASTTDVIVMEKMIVEATEMDSPSGILGGLFHPRKAWLYVAVPDYEILSQCDTEQTDSVSRHIARSLRGNRQFIPKDYLEPLATPMSFIMFAQRPSPAMEALVPGANQFEPGSNNFGNYAPNNAGEAGGVVTWDQDTHCVVQNRAGARWAWAGGTMSTGPIPTGTLFELSRCTPALPLWYLYGFDGSSGLQRGMPGVWATAKWISPDETKAIVAAVKRSGSLSPLPPIEKLFELSRGPDGGLPKAPPSPEWAAEAALFLRWGFINEPEKPNRHSQAFFDFVQRSRVERVTEAMFRQCFGFGYAKMQQILTRYLIDAVDEPIPAAPYAHEPDRPDVRWYDDLDGPQPVLSRTATPAEVARILGDWERMRGNDLRVSDPALSKVFLDHAGRTLHRAYAAGERDPLMLAVLGLYDFDVSNFAEAALVLSEATNAKVARPGAYVDLAQIEYDEALAHPAANGGKFSPEQTAAILKPLFAVRQLARLDATGYDLIAKAWQNCAAKPKARNLAVLGEGCLLYPFDSALCSAAAQVYAHWGYITEAAAFLKRGSEVANGATSSR